MSSSTDTQTPPSHSHTVRLVFVVVVVVIRVIAKDLLQLPAQPSLRRRLIKYSSGVHLASRQNAACNLALHAIAPSTVLVLDAHHVTVEADHGFAVVVAEAVGGIVVFFGDGGGDGGAAVDAGACRAAVVGGGVPVVESPG